MNLEKKIQNPICIKIGKDSNVILADEECKEEYPLIPGVMFGGEHFGFITISDSNREQRECFYPTQCRIEAIGVESGILKIFEEGKKSSWRFNKSGKMEYSAFGDFTDEFRRKFDTIKDKKIVEEVYDLKEPQDKDIFTLQMKKNRSKVLK